MASQHRVAVINDTSGGGNKKRKVDVQAYNQLLEITGSSNFFIIASHM
jgi:hypothetical protein